jgi:adenine/guanine phosphoribosyltransferase-like PRPP-binding protein
MRTHPAPTTQYLHAAFSPNLFARTVDRTAEVAAKIMQQYPFDTIAFTGVSGAAMAFPLSYKMDIPLLCVRKNSDDSHYSRSSSTTCLEGNMSVYKYIIVDDTLCTGETVNRIMDSIHAANALARCVAMILYAQWGDDYQYHRTRGCNNITQEPIDIFMSKVP